LLLVRGNLDVSNLEHITPAGNASPAKQQQGAETEDQDTGQDELTHRHFLECVINADTRVSP
jgi:hypothetical protein